MRLIDADKLKSELFDADWMMDNDEHMVEKIVERQPTVDAEPFITGETSDGYHTFNELYHHRAVLFSVIVKAFEDKAWKSRKHHDGTMYDGMFIVGVETPYGQATYHYDMEPYWEMFCCKEIERAPEWDGHTPAQAIERIGKLEPVRHGRWEWRETWSDETPEYPRELCEDGWACSACGVYLMQYLQSHFHDIPSYAECASDEMPTVERCPNCGAKMKGCEQDKAD